MIIFLNAKGVLNQYLGEVCIPVKLSDNAKLDDLINLIGRKYNKKLPDFLWNYEEARFRGPVVFSINNKIASDSATRLEDGQKVEIVLALVGG
jgi:hypothetical protein